MQERLDIIAERVHPLKGWSDRCLECAFEAHDVAIEPNDSPADVLHKLEVRHG